MNGALPSKAGRAAFRDSRALLTVAAGIPEQRRHRVAGAGFDADMTAPAGHTKQENDVRLLPQQLRQVAADRSICGCQEVRRKINVGEGGAPSARQRFDQRGAGIDRCARKRAEADQQNLHLPMPSRSAICSTAALTASRPAATSASMRGSAALIV